MIAGAVGFELGFIVMMSAVLSANSQVGSCDPFGSMTCRQLDWQLTAVTAGRITWGLSIFFILAGVAFMIASNPNKQLAALDPRDSLKPVSANQLKRGTIHGLLIAIGTFVGSFLGVLIGSLFVLSNSSPAYVFAVFCGFFGGGALGAYTMYRYLRRKPKHVTPTKLNNK